MKLRHIELHTTRMEAAVRFYQLLGLRVVVDQRPDHVLFAGDGEDGGTLSLLRFAVVPNLAGGPLIYFECDNVDEIHRRASGDGLKFSFAPVSKPSGRREAGLLDPDGQLICIYHNEPR
jgi:catechol 2,3-dioxygenase-like lactoylglutathione lyase family enzyme